VGVAAVFTALGACSKTNNVDQSTALAVGEQCGRPDDPGCGPGAVCALGFCRHGCTTDAECAQGAICIGDMPPFGCSLPAEIACSSSQPCEAEALSCGIDGVCRLPCEQDADCSRNEHHCIAGSCVGEGERGFETWAGCETGSVQCSESSFQECNVTAPGWVEAKNCGADICTVPEGRCLELVTEPAGDILGLTVVDGALYWINSEGDIVSSATVPGSPNDIAIDLPPDGYDADRRVKGPLVGVVGMEGDNVFAQMSRVDGTLIFDVDAGPNATPNREPRGAMPTTAGLFWIESREGSETSYGQPVLVHLGVDAMGSVTPTELGPVASIEVNPIHSYCAIDDTLYFIADGVLYRTAGTAIEGPLDAPVGLDLACSDNQVFLLSANGISKIDSDGTATQVVEYTFTAGLAGKGSAAMVLVGDEVLATTQTALVAANVVTGEVRDIIGFDVKVGQGAFAADEEYLYMLVTADGGPGAGPARIMRTTWND